MKLNVTELYWSFVNALEAADAAALSAKDCGACNFDQCIIEKPAGVTYAVFMETMKNAGLLPNRLTGQQRGWIACGVLRGMAAKNTAFAHCLAGSLVKSGLRCSVLHFID